MDVKCTVLKLDNFIFIHGHKAPFPCPSSRSFPSAAQGRVRAQTPEKGPPMRAGLTCIPRAWHCCVVGISQINDGKVLGSRTRPRLC